MRLPACSGPTTKFVFVSTVKLLEVTLSEVVESQQWLIFAHGRRSREFATRAFKSENSVRISGSLIRCRDPSFRAYFRKRMRSAQDDNSVRYKSASRRRQN